jgi:hypothetical protein
VEITQDKMGAKMNLPEPPKKIQDPLEAFGKKTHKQRQLLDLGGKVGRNDPCFCGSGSKLKRCCGWVAKSALERREIRTQMQVDPRHFVLLDSKDKIVSAGGLAFVFPSQDLAVRWAEATNTRKVTIGAMSKGRWQRFQRDFQYEVVTEEFIKKIERGEDSEPVLRGQGFSSDAVVDEGFKPKE